ncbi:MULTISPECIES: GntR family transcriptional regulator [Brevibacterium]|uniref:GntR family transcriptional regulator n=1 Tax=Brevibacterium salitolerans TaxID=1403566 RepID=A0ABN2WRG7_9MICO|nr:GntR family transcriptional regulator [Brevibacterium sp.]
MATRDTRGRRRERSPLPEEVASYVRELIISGQIRAGEFIRMEPIAEAVGVSITPVREGLLTLRNEGFVRLVPRRGFVVSSFSTQDVRDIFWAQSQLAGELAARAAGRITESDIAALRTNITEFDAAVAAGDTEDVTFLGRQFHKIINRSAESYRLALLLESIASQLPPALYATIEEQVEDSHVAHPAIVDALAQGDAAAARVLTITHTTGSADYLIANLQAQGLWSDEEQAESA